uniref:Uncharacterized protein n=1 Tax=Anopheles atroparvus TaxID=41427 RepID=A0A182ILT3_ANOAO
MVAGGRQVVHLRGERVVAGVEQRRRQPILHHALGRRRQLQPWLALERRLVVPQGLMVPQLGMVVVRVVMLPVQSVVMVVVVVMPARHDLDRLDVAGHLVVGGQQKALALHQLFLLLQGVLLLEAAPAAQERPVVEHVVRVRIERPVAALARLLVVPGHLHEALVEAEVVPDRVLPALLVVPVVREPVHDVLVDAVQRDLLVRRVLDRHRDQRDVRVRRLHHLLVLVRCGQGVGRAGVRVPGVLVVRVVVRRGHRWPVRRVAGLRVPIVALVQNTRNTEKAKAEELSRVRPTDRLIATPCYTPDRPRTRRCQASNIHTRIHTYTLGQEKEGRKEKERLPKQPTGSRYAVPISTDQSRLMSGLGAFFGPLSPEAPDPCEEVAEECVDWTSSSGSVSSACASRGVLSTVIVSFSHSCSWEVLRDSASSRLTSTGSSSCTNRLLKQTFPPIERTSCSSSVAPGDSGGEQAGGSGSRWCGRSLPSSVSMLCVLSRKSHSTPCPLSSSSNRSSMLRDRRDAVGGIAIVVPITFRRIACPPAAPSSSRPSSILGGSGGLCETTFSPAAELRRSSLVAAALAAVRRATGRGRVLSPPRTALPYRPRPLPALPPVGPWRAGLEDLRTYSCASEE